MFRKIISGLSYSPALIESLSKLATHLKNEERIRQLGVVFLVVAIILQIFTLLRPPASSNVANISDTFYGGFGSLDTFMSAYDKNEQHIRDMLTSLGITRYDLLQSKHQKNDNIPKSTYTISQGLALTNKDNKLIKYRTSGDITDTSRQIAYLTTIDTTPKKSTIYTGNNSLNNWFGIDMSNGEILVEAIPTPVDIEDLCPIKQTGSINCDNYYSQSAYNETQSKNATSSTAKSDDHIVYSFTIKNPEKSADAISVPMTVNLSDALEYSKVIDSGTGIYDSQSSTITWPRVTVTPGQSITNIITVSILHDIPGTSTGISNPSSYDCNAASVLSTSTLAIPIKCPIEKQLENVLLSLPKLSGVMITVEIAIFLLIVYLYFRSRQIKEEVRLIRRDLNSGTI